MPRMRQDANNGYDYRTMRVRGTRRHILHQTPNQCQLAITTLVVIIIHPVTLPLQLAMEVPQVVPTDHQPAMETTVVAICRLDAKATTVVVRCHLNAMVRTAAAPGLRLLPAKAMIAEVPCLLVVATVMTVAATCHPNVMAKTAEGQDLKCHLPVMVKTAADLDHNHRQVAPNPSPGTGAGSPPYPTPTTGEMCPGPQCRAHETGSMPSNIHYGHNPPITPAPKARRRLSARLPYSPRPRWPSSSLYLLSHYNL